MIVMVVHYMALPGRGDEVAAGIERVAPLVAALEPGCVHYHACRDTTNPDHFLLYEQYVDEAALEAHRETSHFKEIVLGEIVPLLDTRERTFYSLVAG